MTLPRHLGVVQARNFTVRNRLSQHRARQPICHLSNGSERSSQRRLVFPAFATVISRSRCVSMARRATERILFKRGSFHWRQSQARTFRGADNIALAPSNILHRYKRRGCPDRRGRQEKRECRIARSQSTSHRREVVGCHAHHPYTCPPCQSGALVGADGSVRYEAASCVMSAAQLAFWMGQRQSLDRLRALNGNHHEKNPLGRLRTDRSCRG